MRGRRFNNYTTGHFRSQILGSPSPFGIVDIKHKMDECFTRPCFFIQTGVKE